VDDPDLVRGFKGLGDLPGDGQRLVERQGPARAMRSDSSWPSTNSITSAVTSGAFANP
jgi:hypothetical protein